eukprot:scaffold148236_cov76-Attheya_sp.AAC.1
MRLGTGGDGWPRGYRSLHSTRPHLLFLAYYWVDFSRSVRDDGLALVATDGCDGRFSSPCVSLLVISIWVSVPQGMRAPAVTDHRDGAMTAMATDG